MAVEVDCSDAEEYGVSEADWTFGADMDGKFTLYQLDSRSWPDARAECRLRFNIPEYAWEEDDGE